MSVLSDHSFRLSYVFGKEYGATCQICIRSGSCLASQRSRNQLSVVLSGQNSGQRSVVRSKPLANGFYCPANSRTLQGYLTAEPSPSEILALTLANYFSEIEVLKEMYRPASQAFP